jgi:hypothetical protein
MAEQPKGSGIMSPELATTAHEAATGDPAPQLGCVVVGAATGKGVTPKVDKDPMAMNSYSGAELPQTD